MSFQTGYLADTQPVGAGEEHGNTNRVLGHREFGNNLMCGRFARVDAVTGSLEALDGSATPVIAGVVLRRTSTAVEAGGTIDATLTTGAISYMQDGFVSVQVKAGETPAYKGEVFASNDGDADDGTAVTAGGVATGAVFIEEIRPDVWLIDQK